MGNSIESFVYGISAIAVCFAFVGLLSVIKKKCMKYISKKKKRTE